MSVDVCILGAGTMGLSVACNLQKLISRVRVTVVADRFGKDAISPISSGLILPVPGFFGDMPQELVEECMVATWKHHSAMTSEEDLQATGQRLIAGYYMWDDPKDRIIPTATFNFKRLGKIEKCEKNLTYPNVCTFTTVQADEAKYLNWLMKQFRQNGGLVLNDKVAALQKLYGKYDIVVNCLSKSARDLVADPDILPLKVHCVTVKAPWANNFYVTSDHIAAIPNSAKDQLTVGYIYERHVFTNHLDPEITDLLLHKAKSQIHRLLGCEVVEKLTDLVQARAPPKVEVEMLNCGGPILPVIHCLGLEPEPLALSWGLGVHVAHLVQDVFRSIRPFSKTIVPFGRLM